MCTGVLEPGLRILELLEEAGAPQSARMVERMRRLARQGSGAVQLGKGVWFAATPGRLALERPPREAPPLEAVLDLDALEEGAVFPLGGGKALEVRRFPEGCSSFRLRSQPSHGMSQLQGI